MCAAGHAWQDVERFRQGIAAAASHYITCAGDNAAEWPPQGGDGGSTDAVPAAAPAVRRVPAGPTRRRAPPRLRVAAHQPPRAKCSFAQPQVSTCVSAMFNVFLPSTD